MIVKVTQENIDNGTAADCRACPIALAVLSATKLEGKFNKVSVARCSVWFVTPEDVFDYKLPESARMFIQRFDSGQMVYPFEFELSVD
ncbi:MAG TPA: hypothetical protein VEP90_19905 [Methylomirabilota bacterium]|nr:hypothetical protein [Methylomirabilota bacterium]